MKHCNFPFAQLNLIAVSTHAKTLCKRQVSSPEVHTYTDHNESKEYVVNYLCMLMNQLSTCITKHKTKLERRRMTYFWNWKPRVFYYITVQNKIFCHIYIYIYCACRAARTWRTKADGPSFLIKQFRSILIKRVRTTGNSLIVQHKDISFHAKTSDSLQDTAYSTWNW